MGNGPRRSFITWHAFARAAAAYTALVGAAGLAGWIWGIPWLRGEFLAGISIKVNTGLGLAALGAALLLLIPRTAGTMRRVCGRALAVLPIALGALTLTEHLSGWDLWIDTLLYSEPAGAAATASPGRMGPPASLSFVLAGCSLLLLDRRTRRSVRVTHVQVLALAVCGIALLPLIGFIYGADQLFGVARYTGIAAVTATALAALGMGILAARPDRGLMSVLAGPSTGGVLARRVLPLVIGLPIVLGWLWVHGQRLLFYDTAFGAALLVGTLVLLLSAFVLWIAAAIARGDRNLADLFDNAPIGLHLLGPDGTILRANHAELAMMGYARSEYIGQPISRFYADQDSASAVLGRLARGEEIHSHEVRLRCKDGSFRHVLLSANALYEDGRFIHTRCFTRDITERRTAELALAQHARDLARSVKDLENFAHIIAHDLKEPLRGMRLTIGMLVEDCGDRLGPDDLQRLATLDALAGRMTELLEATLQFSRVGYEPVRLNRADLGLLTAEALEGLRTRLAESGAEVRVESPLPTLECDPALVRQILTNLVTNAIKYNEAPSKLVRIGVHTDGTIPTLYVSDNGIGIPPQHRQDVFNMFKRLHGPNRYGSGTGAGLAIVKRVVERHGGRIWVESEPGKGSTFYFTLAGEAPHYGSPAPSAHSVEA